MNILFYAILLFAILAFVVSDIITKRLLNTKIVAFVTLFVVNNSFLFFAGSKEVALHHNLPLTAFTYTLFISLFAYIWVRLQLVSCSTEKGIPIRTKVIYNGRRLLYFSLALGIIQLLIAFNYSSVSSIVPVTTSYFVYSNVFAYVLILITFLNGWFRIFILSSRLRVTRRIIVSLFIWFPVINIPIILYMCRMASFEYDHACNKVYAQNLRKESSLCQTRYPLLLLHGVGFRDFKYVNYWGRIPKNLVRNGATVYYGHQEALGTIEDNAAMVRDKIVEIVNATGCERVNIIAHSKGGLDARYTISRLGMGDYVASLTTISTPHRGSFLADFGNKHLSDKTYRSVANRFDNYFLKIGDKNPDFYTATHQFTKEYAEMFNADTPDVGGIYYQSYMSLMKNCFSHLLLMVPYLIMCRSDKKNDGLVTLDSAKWGEFKSVFTNKKFRGISHGDMIDLGREDYRGFNVIETYINIVSDLREKGY